MAEGPHLLTTWQAARYCGVSPYTVRNWVNSGRLPAFRTPGGHRRIRRPDLDAFLEAHAMPLPAEFRGGGRRLLFLVAPGQRRLAEMAARWSPDFEVEVPSSAFEAGFAFLAFRPHFVLVDLSDERWDGLEICRRLYRSAETAHVRVAALLPSEDAEALEALEESGVQGHFTLPVEPLLLRRYLRKLFPHCRWSPQRRRTRPSSP
jgi:excisionase family DNA binding protein